MAMDTESQFRVTLPHQKASSFPSPYFKLRGVDMRLTTTWAKYVLACVLAFGLGSLAWTTQENQTKTKAGKSVTVTGCLQKGDEAGEYSVTGEDGKRYGLHGSNSGDLSKHLG